jgi:hypothetical protein
MSVPLYKVNWSLLEKAGQVPGGEPILIAGDPEALGKSIRINGMKQRYLQMGKAQFGYIY